MPEDIDLVSFACMKSAYAENNLSSHDGKEKRRASAGTFWGGNIDGVRRLVCAPRERTFAQMIITLLLVQTSCAPLLLIQMVLGGWILCSCFAGRFLRFSFEFLLI